jgi:hypothetical protein
MNLALKVSHAQSNFYCFCKKVKLSLQHSVEASRVVRRRGSHIFLQNWLTDGDEVVSLTYRTSFTPTGNFLVLISVRGWVDSKSHNAAGRIRSSEKSSDLIGNRTRDLPVCSIVPQPTTLPRAPRPFTGRKLFIAGINIKTRCKLIK